MRLATPAWPLSPLQQTIAGLVLSLSNFMVMLDLTVANVSVPHISGNLGVTPDQGTWVITSYAVAEAICVPLTGWLAGRFGSVRVFNAAMLGFGLFSCLCGLAPTLGLLIAARIGQGICGAPLLPLGQALLTRAFPPERQVRAMAVWSVIVLLAPATGPIVGGIISDNVSWHWIFLINVPLAIICLALGLALLPKVETPTVRQPIDVVGLALLVFWIGCLQIMLDIGRDHDWFGDWKILALAIGAGLGFLVFVIWELTDEHPAVNLRVFRHRAFAVGTWVLALTYSAYVASIVIIPQWLQLTQRYTATDAGLITAFTAITSAITGLFMARIVTRFDLRVPITVGIGWFTIQCFVRSGWIAGMDFWSMALAMTIQGFGMSMFIIPLMQLSMSAVLPQEVPAAAGLQHFLRTSMIAVSTSLVLTDWSNMARVKHNAIADVLRPDGVVRDLAERGIDPETARHVINNLVDEQAMTIAMDHTFLLAGFGGLFMVGLVWLVPRTRLYAQAGGH